MLRAGGWNRKLAGKKMRINPLNLNKINRFANYDNLTGPPLKRKTLYFQLDDPYTPTPHSPPPPKKNIPWLFTIEVTDTFDIPLAASSFSIM